MLKFKILPTIPLLFGLSCASYRPYVKEGDEAMEKAKSMPGAYGYNPACQAYSNALWKLGEGDSETHREIKMKNAEACYLDRAKDMQNKMADWQATDGILPEKMLADYLHFRMGTLKYMKPYLDAKHAETAEELKKMDEYFIEKLNLSTGIARDKARKQYYGYFVNFDRECKVSRETIKDLPSAFREHMEKYCKWTGEELVALIRYKIADKSTKPLTKAAFRLTAYFLNLPGFTRDDILLEITKARAGYFQKINLTIADNSRCPALLSSFMAGMNAMPGNGSRLDVRYDLSSCTTDVKVTPHSYASTDTNRKYKRVTTRKWVSEDVIVGYNASQSCSPAFTTTYYGTPSGGIQTNTTRTVSSCGTVHTPIYRHFEGYKDVDEMLEIPPGYLYTCTARFDGILKVEGREKKFAVSAGIMRDTKNEKGSDVNPELCRNAFLQAAMRWMVEKISAETTPSLEDRLAEQSRNSPRDFEEWIASVILNPGANLYQLREKQFSESGIHCALGLRYHLMGTTDPFDVYRAENVDCSPGFLSAMPK